VPNGAAMPRFDTLRGGMMRFSSSKVPAAPRPPLRWLDRERERHSTSLARFHSQSQKARQPRHPAHSKPATICYTHPHRCGAITGSAKSPTQITPTRGVGVSGFRQPCDYRNELPRWSPHLRAMPLKPRPESPADDPSRFNPTLPGAAPRGNRVSRRHLHSRCGNPLRAPGACALTCHPSRPSPTSTYTIFVRLPDLQSFAAGLQTSSNLHLQNVPTWKTPIPNRFQIQHVQMRSD